MPLATVRVADLAAASTAPWRRLVPHRNSSNFDFCSGSGLAAGPPGFAEGASVAAACSARAASISKADSRFTAVSYLPPTGLRERTLALPVAALPGARLDLAGRYANLPVYKLMGGARDKVKAYASTYPNIGKPQVYADHALQCKNEGYQAYKIHPHYFWNPATGTPTPGRPSVLHRLPIGQGVASFAFYEDNLAVLLAPLQELVGVLQFVHAIIFSDGLLASIIAFL